MASKKYYINGVLQDYVPITPNPDLEMELDNVAKIGHPDTIDKRYTFKVSTKILNQDEIDKQD